VQLYPTVKSQRDSFKMLDPKHKRPVKQQLVDIKGEVVERADTVKGVEQAPDQYAVLPKAGVDALALLGKTTVAAPRGFCSLDTIPFTLAQGTYAVVPNSKVPGSDGPVNIIWNGLRDNELAYVTEITMRAGSPDRIVVFWADQEALYATALPYLEDVNPPTGHRFTVDAKQAKVFGQFLGTNEEYAPAAFEHGAFKSEHKRLRAEAVQAAIEGKEFSVPAQAEEPAEAPDLMAALEAAVSAAKAPPKKRPAKKTTSKKAVKA
jgi:DNA end-binding protein Ku